MKALKLLFFSLLLFAASCVKTHLAPHNLITKVDSTSGKTFSYDFVIDSVNHVITLNPVTGDNTPQLDSVVNYNNTHAGGFKIFCEPGNYTFNNSIIGANIQAGAYHQLFVDLEGFTNAKDAPSNVTTNFFFTNPNGFGLGLQQCKGCTVANIAFYGPFNFPNTLNIIQIDTLPWNQWSDGLCRNNRTSPTAGIAIDPFSDPGWYNGTTTQMYPGDSAYYLVGMGQAGSTDVRIDNCMIRKWVVGIITTPSFQLNGDEIQINSCQVDQVASAIAFTQAQSKACTVNNLMSWGQTHTVFDGDNFGPGRGDGQNPPVITQTSIAGNTYQIFDYLNPAFPLEAYNVYAENLCKIGRVNSNAGNLMSGAQIDLQVATAGVPSPDFYWYGPFTTWEACMIRVYNGTKNFGRIVLNSQGNIFNGGSVSDPPICKDSATIRHQDQPGNYPTVFNGVFGQYTNQYLQGNGWDSVVLVGNDSVYISPSSFTGYFMVPASVGAGISFADPIVYDAFLTENLLTTTFMWEIPMGFVTSVSTGATQDTVYLRNTGLHCYTGKYNLFDVKLKAGF